jgi:DNA-binding transcriptional LysR family regulator
MSFDWNDLRYYLAVARTGRLTAAAKRLTTDHATVSRRIAALEGKIGTALFARSPLGYALTEAGERLLSYAEAIEREASNIQNEIAGENFALTGTVRIAAPDGFGAYFLAPLVGELSQKHPELELQLIAMPRIFSLSKREADIAIVLQRPKKGRLAARKLTYYSLHLYASPRFLEECGPVDSISDLKKLAFIGYIPELIFTPELDYLSTLNLTKPFRLSSTNLVAQFRAACAGVGVAVLPDFMVHDKDNLSKILGHQFQLRRTFWIVSHLDSRNSLRVRTTIDFIASKVSERRQEFLPDSSTAF